MVRPTMRLEVGCVQGLECGLGASGQASEGYECQVLKAGHGLSLSSGRRIFRVVSRDGYTNRPHFYTTLERVSALEMTVLQSLT